MSPFKFIPLAAVLGLLPVGAIAQSDQPTVIPVELSEFKFAPSEIVLNKGQSYVLRLTDTGKRAHDLSAKAFFQTVSLTPDSVKAVQDGDVDLTPGVVADVAFTPNQAGTYEMHCTHPLHAMLGMKGHIVVR
jgi:uncharacterized cupredoxin-like copper-binding protein